MKGTVQFQLSKISSEGLQLVADLLLQVSGDTLGNAGPLQVGKEEIVHVWLCIEAKTLT